MKLNVRHVPFHTAEKEFLKFLLDWQPKHEITEAELLLILTKEINRIASSAVAEERRNLQPEKANNEPDAS